MFQKSEELISEFQLKNKPFIKFILVCNVSDFSTMSIQNIYSMF